MAQTGVKQTAIGFLALALGAVGLAGCAGVVPDTSAQAGGLRPLHIVTKSLILPALGPPRPLLRDTCGASALAGLVGRPRTQIPVPVDLSHRRVVCTACPVASDVRLDRINILYDARTGLVTKITCG